MEKKCVKFIVNSIFKKIFHIEKNINLLELIESLDNLYNGVC